MIAAADGSDIRTLVGGVTATGDISWSPSGDRLAVIGTMEGRRGLWIVGTDGTRTLVRPEEGGTGDGLLREPTWLPNGQDLLFVGGPIDTGTPTAGLYQVHADGSDVRSIVAPKVPGPTQSSLSPDGSRVAFAVGTSDRSELHVVDIASAVDVAVAFDGALDDRRPQWSPDGRTLLFERYRGGTYQLAVGSADGGPVTLIGPEQPANSGGSHARFTPDGSRVLAFYESDGSSWVLDPVSGAGTQLSIDIDSPLSWQGTTP
jgi:Tol biopolymer transport system component